MPRSSGFQLSRSVRLTRPLKAFVALAAVLTGLLVAGPHMNAAPARAASSGVRVQCVHDTYAGTPGSNPADGTQGCQPGFYPVVVANQSLRYLAMGDSYSSGESVPRFVRGSIIGYDSNFDTCDRSHAAASAVLAGELPSLLHLQNGVDRQFIACSGAKSGSLLGSYGQNGELSQGAQQSFIESHEFDGAADLVTLTAGGNDVHFADIVSHCVWTTDCESATPYFKKILATMDHITPVLEKAYAAVAESAGTDASVLVADYPQLFAPSPVLCYPALLILGGADVPQMRVWTTHLNSSVQKAAQEAGVHFVDVAPLFAAHPACSQHPWLNTVVNREGKYTQVWDNAGSFHPNAQGQAGYAEAYANYIKKWRSQGNPLTSAGLPQDVVPLTPNGVSLGTGNAAARLSVENVDDTSDATLQMDDLSLTPSDASACPTSFAAGESLRATGGGYAPGSTVTLSVMPGTAEAQSYSVTADDSGDIDATIVLPAVLSGKALGTGSVGYAEATGSGDSTTEQSDNNLFAIGDSSPGCGNPVLTGAQVSVELLGDDSPFRSLSGATFAVDGPGLPVSAGAPPGGFAELDTDADELTSCSAQEPAGVQCLDGVIGGLDPDATYTVTQLQAPAGYAVAAPVSVTASEDGTIADAAFDDAALGSDYESGDTAASCGLCVLSGTGTSLSATGNSRVTWAGIGTSNSTSATATTATGSSVLSGQSFFNSGGVKLTGTGHLTTATPPTAGSTQDPFSWYHLPTQSGTGAALTATGTQVVDAHPGVYSKITASGNAKLTLEPGTYVIAGGGLSVSGSAKLTASGATVYLACSAYPAPCSGAAGSGVALSGAAVVSLTGGAVGPGDGFALLADPADAAPMTVAGSASLTVDGTIEAPAASLTVSGSGTVGTTTGEVVLSTVSVSGSASVDVEGDPLPDL